MRKITRIVTLLVCLVLGGLSAHAAVKYWDIDGTTPGAGGATPSGTWDTGTTANWTQDPTGTSAAETWAANDSAVFSAGTDAVGSFTVTVSGTPAATGITFEEGVPTLSGGTIAMSATPFPMVANGNGVIGSILSGTELTKTGTGTLTLNGANNYIGVTTVSAGVIAVGSANALGSTVSNTVVSSGAAVHISGGIALAEPLSFTSPGDGVDNTGAFRSLSGSNAVDFIYGASAVWGASRINIDSGTLFVRAIYGPNRTAITFGGDGNTIIGTPTAVFNSDGLLWGGEGGGVTKEGTGTLVLNANTTIRGTFKVSAGTAVMGNDNRFGNPGPVHPDMSVDGVLDLNGYDNAVDGLYGAGSVINAGTSTLVVTTNGSVAQTHNSDPIFTGVISGGTTIKKEGTARTQTFSGHNTYTGNTIVKAGTLKLGATGSISNSPNIIVSAGAAFDVSAVTGYAVVAGQSLTGNGTVAGAVAVASGGQIGAGESAGTLTLGAGLDLSGGGTNVWELAANSTSDPGTNSDQIVLSGGSLTLGGASVLSIRFTGTATTPVSSDPFWQAERTWRIISATGAASNFAQIENGSFAAGNFSTSVDANGILLTFTPNATPMPTPPHITSIIGAGTASVTVNYTNTLAGTNYTLQYNTNLSTANWYDVGTAAAPGTSASQNDSPPAGEAERYYRVFYVTP